MGFPSISKRNSKMPGSQPAGSGRNRSGSQLARVREQDNMPSSLDVSEHGGTEEMEDRANGFFRQRNESSPSRLSFSSSLNQKTPARSYFQHSFQDSHREIHLPDPTKHSVLSINSSVHYHEGCLSRCTGGYCGACVVGFV